MKLKIEEGRAVLATKATPAVMNVVPLLEGRRVWLKGGGGLSLEPTPHNINLIATALGAEIIAPDPEPVRASLRAVKTYQSKTEDYPHQAQVKTKLRTKNHFALFLEQGTGKSKIAIDRAGELFCAGVIDAVLVVSKKGVHRQWCESEFPHHCGIKFDALFWKPKARDLKRFMDAPRGKALQVFAFNYDGIKTKAGIEAALDFCKRHRGRMMIICDESQEIKNASSQRARALLSLAGFASHRMILTGTPIAKDLTDEWAQLKWLDEGIIGIRYVSAFRNHFCVMGGFEGRVVIGHKNIDEFKRRVEPFAVRVTKEEIGMLPKQFNEWTFDLTPEQVRAIRELKRQLETELDDGAIVSVANAVAAMTKLQQAASGFLIDKEAETVHSLLPIEKNPRVAAMLEYIDADEGKAIVWFRYRQEGRLIADALRSAGISFVEYHGGTGNDERAEAIRQFVQAGGARIFVANPQSAGTGLNLQGYCNRALYFSNSFSAVDRWQSEDRIHRIGTVGAVVYTDLVAKGSLDRHIIANLRRKKGLSDLVLGDLRQIVRELGT